MRIRHRSDLLAEDVIPSTTVQAGRVIPDLVQEFLHLECCGNGLDQDRSSNQTVRESNVGGRPGEDVIPESAEDTG